MNSNQILNNANCELTVVCGRNWDDFDKTEEDGIKFCNHCQQAVFLTRTSAEVRIAAEKGLCVYIVPMSEAWESGQLFEVSRERIRAIEAKALRKMQRGHLTGQVKIRDSED